MTTKVEDWFKDNTVAFDLFSVCAGERLGEGISRAVYLCPFDNTLVFKFETEDCEFGNVCEWKLWEEVKDFKSISNWFAPCVWISNSGKVMVQERTTPIPKHQLPKRVPSIFTDIKPDNWGLYKGRPVCHDYAYNLAISKGIGAGARFRKATWRTS